MSRNGLPSTSWALISYRSSIARFQARTRPSASSTTRPSRRLSTTFVMKRSRTSISRFRAATASRSRSSMSASTPTPTAVPISTAIRMAAFAHSWWTSVGQMTQT